MKSIVAMAQDKVVKAINNEVNSNDKLINAIMEYTKSFNRNDASAKDLFCLLLSLHRTTKDKSQLLLQLGEIYNRVSNGNMKIVSNLKEVTKLADKANSNKLVIKLDMAYFYNIKEAIKIMEASSMITDVTRREAVQSDIRKSLFDCYTKESDTMISYNNKVTSKIKELRKTHNMVDIDGVTIITTLKGKIDKLSHDELVELSAYITTKL
ncbi:MAG: hypothetical protein PHH29_17135 [Desulfuromonadaceae bacterium]|nr:hypothetical protein [Desulfuromonadaceae bacterium]